jgi:hypothetical protein
LPIFCAEREKKNKEKRVLEKICVETKKLIVFKRVKLKIDKSKCSGQENSDR